MSLIYNYCMKSKYSLTKILFTIFALLAFILIIWNLDIAIRAFRNIQNDTFSTQRLRLDISAFNIGQESSIKPIDSKTSGKDGMIQLFVPEGNFLMGKEGEPD